MLETLTQYRNRTNFMWNSLPSSGKLRTSDGLALKVSPEGRFKPFYGDTVIFFLPEPMIQWLDAIQDALYAACGTCLGERIASETFHITLHDLSNQANCMPSEVSTNKVNVMQALEEIWAQVPHSILIRSVCAFSMVGTSLVMGFEPASGPDCQALMELYERFQQIVPLSYPLTLHATLAYYKPGEYDEAMLSQLNDALRRIGRNQQEWRLDLRDLHYATFESMNQYTIL